MGMPVVFANPAASRSRHISSLKIAQLRYENVVMCRIRVSFLRVAGQ